MKRRERAPRAAGLALAGTIAVHGLAGAFLIWLGAGGRVAAPPTYRVRLVAAPAPDPAARRAPDAIDRPAEREMPAPVKRPTRSTASKAPPPRTADATPREAAPRTTPKVELAPGEKPSTGNAVGTVSTEGIDFPFPEYIENLWSQIRRRWQRPEQSTALEAEVSFFVGRDGRIQGPINFVKRSGNFAFDLEAQGAVEEAGRSGVFGPLPTGWSSDVLFIRFFFSGRH
jgi:outer membrane biosynthesis protein TonB